MEPIGADREDTLTRAEYLAARGYDTNGASNGLAPTEAPSDAADEQSGPNPGRVCAWCGAELPDGAHGLSRYCGAKCRRAAKSARERPRAAGVVLTVPAAGVGLIEAVDEPPAPFPVAEVNALLGLGSVGAVTVERDGWRLVVHPRT
jgi:hypothetical protein